MDLIGTCHSELQKPAILKPEHLILYKLHWNRRQDAVSAMQREQSVHSALEEVKCSSRAVVKSLERDERHDI